MTASGRQRQRPRRAPRPHWLRNLRHARGWTMAETARKIGCSDRHAWALEAGDVFLTDAMRGKIAKAFGLSVAELLRTENRKEE